MQLNNVRDTIPAHVRRSSSAPVRSAGAERSTKSYETIIPAIHAGPAIFMAPDAYLGLSPAWVFPRAEPLLPAMKPGQC